jgi:hypothetical protein
MKSAVKVRAVKVRAVKVRAVKVRAVKVAWCPTSSIPRCRLIQLALVIQVIMSVMPQANVSHAAMTRGAVPDGLQITQ